MDKQSDLMNVANRRAPEDEFGGGGPVAETLLSSSMVRNFSLEHIVATRDQLNAEIERRSIEKRCEYTLKRILNVANCRITGEGCGSSEPVDLLEQIRHLAIGALSSADKTSKDQ